MFKLPCTVALGLAGALPAQPGWAQVSAPDASAFQRGEWAEPGGPGDGATRELAPAVEEAA